MRHAAASSSVVRVGEWWAPCVIRAQVKETVSVSSGRLASVATARRAEVIYINIYVHLYFRPLRGRRSSLSQKMRMDHLLLQTTPVAAKRIVLARAGARAKRRSRLGRDRAREVRRDRRGDAAGARADVDEPAVPCRER